MTKNEIEILKRMEPMTWLLAVVGVFVYGVPVVYLNIRDGFPLDLGHVVFSLWGLAACSSSLWLLRQTFKAKKG